MSDGGAQRHVFGPFFDDDGDIYRGIKVLVTTTGTTNAKTYWTDETKTTAVNSGVLTDSDNDGIASAFFDGDYRFRVTQSNDSALDTAIDWDTTKVTSDTATMWEGNFGTTFPTAAATNIWHMFAKVTAGNELSFIGINNGSDFIQFAQPIGVGADVVSASELPVISDGNYFDVTGTTTLTSIATLGIGTTIRLHFDAVLTITHNATNLVLPNNQDITTIAGDEITFIEYATGDWRLIAWSRPDNIASVTLDSPTIDNGITLNGDAWPSFSVNRSSGGSQLNITGLDKVRWTDEDFDTNSDFEIDADDSGGATESRFTPTVTGKYLLSVTVRWVDNSSGDNLTIVLKKNGTSDKLFSLAAGANNNDSLIITVVVDANGTTDYFEIFAENVDSDTSDLSGLATDTFFTGSRIA